MLYINKNQCSEAVSNGIKCILSTSEWEAIPDPASEELTDAERSSAVRKLRGKFDELDKSQVRECLIKEQHGLCAYCMLPITNSFSTTIEHFLPLSKGKKNALDYYNFLATCKGGSDCLGLTRSQRLICCDAQKQDTDTITVDPRNQSMMDGIYYSTDGLILFDCPSPDTTRNVTHDLDETLRLNGKLDSQHKCVRDTTTQLVKKRKDAYSNAEKICFDLLEMGKLNKDELQKLIENCLSPSKRESMVGVEVFVYKLYLAKVSRQT